MSVLIFLAVLVALVLVHELGHFVVAKWTGMRVDEFGVGFPPRLFGIRRGETEYTLNILPVGGFVKIAGEDGEEDASGTDLEKRGGNGTGRLFTDKSKWAQSAVLIAGITMNILFAWLLVIIAFTAGVRSPVEETIATEKAELTVTNILPGSPAERAGLVPGAVLKSVSSGDTSLDKLTPTSFSTFTEDHASSPLTVMYTAGGELRVAQITPETGIIPQDESRPAIGVALTLIDVVERGVLDALKEASVYIVRGLRDITLGIIDLLRDAFTLKADLSHVAGPVGIVGLVGDASADGFTTLLMFTAFISLNLAVINILPFPALDGGRLLFVLIEVLKGSPIRSGYAQVLNTVGFFILILLMIAVTWNDIARII